jgi:hypothetical protein
MATTYHISAGSLNSILAARGDLEHQTVEAALDAIAAVANVDRAEMDATRGDDMRIYVYQTTEALEADSDGSSALATLTEVGHPAGCSCGAPDCPELLAAEEWL